MSRAASAAMTGWSASLIVTPYLGERRLLTTALTAASRIAPFSVIEERAASSDVPAVPTSF
jgi:hypothetical protein